MANLGLFETETSGHVSTTTLHFHCQHLSYAWVQT